MIIIPEHIQIEIVNGMCTSRCIMCNFRQWERDPHIMKNDTFEKILTKFIPYIKDIKFLTLHGFGEPLLDKDLYKKIIIAKKLEFKNIGLATNCTELDNSTSLKLIKYGLDTIICSIDGINKKTHESIRLGTNFDEIVENIENFIKIRNYLSTDTKIIIRFIKQESNKNEWDKFYYHWKDKLNEKDDVIKFDVHNWADNIDYDENYTENDICDDLYKRILIYSNGKVGFCCADYNGYFDLGSAIDKDPIEIYNNDTYNHYRKMMNKGKIMELEHCKKCTILRSRLKNYNK